MSTNNDEFYRTLRKKVNRYFKDNNVKKTGNLGLYIKAIILFSALLGSLLIMVVSPQLPILVFNMVTYGGKHGWNWLVGYARSGAW